MNRRGRSRIRGMGVFLVFVIIVVLLPITILLATRASLSSRLALMDRNQKTAREISTSSLADFMMSLCTDFNRNVFQDLFLHRSVPNFLGLGDSQVTITPNPDRRSFLVESQGRYLATGRDPRTASNKGLDALVYYRTDIARFGQYWDITNLTLNGRLAPSLCSNWSIQGSVWTRDNLDIRGCRVTIEDGVLVVPGTLTTDNNTTIGPSARVYCRAQTGPLTNQGTLVAQSPSTSPANPYGNNPFFPDLVIDEVDPGRDMSYYESRTSTEIVSTSSMTVTFNPNGTIDFFNHTTAATFNFTQPSTTTVWMASTGTVVVRGVVTRPTTLVIVSTGALGGDVRVEGDVTYNGVPTRTATAERSFALIASGLITFSGPAGSTQNAAGLYYARSRQVRIEGNHALNLSGSLFGLIEQNDQISPNTQLTISPDPQLTRFLPPSLGRKPHIALWRSTQ